MRVYESSSDPVLIKLYSEAEAVDNFGRENFNDWAIEVPDELAKRYFNAHKAFFESQKELDEFLKTRREVPLVPHEGRE